MEFTLNLTEQEVQTVINALCREPYIQVFKVIEKIDQQANEQKNSDKETTAS